MLGQKKAIREEINKYNNKEIGMLELETVYREFNMKTPLYLEREINEGRESHRLKIQNEQVNLNNAKLKQVESIKSMGVSDEERKAMVKHIFPSEE